MHGNARGDARVDRTSRAELRYGADELCGIPSLVSKSGSLLAKEKQRSSRQCDRFDRHRARQIVYRHDRSSVSRSDQVRDAGDMSHVLIAVSHHGAPPIPPAPTDDDHFGGQEGVRRAHDGADVQIVTPVLDRDRELVATAIEVRDDGLNSPISIAVDDVAAITLGEQLGI